MLKIAICDDDKPYLELLSFKIQKIIRENIGIECQIFCFTSIEALQEQFKSDKPDVAFLDIMVNGTNSVNLIATHRTKFGKTPFIIMTGFPTETENLSEVNCCYYLLKSKMTDEQLLRALKKQLAQAQKNIHISTFCHSKTKASQLISIPFYT